MVTGYALKESQPQCPECGSINMIKAGWRFVKRVKTQQYQCRDCGRNTIRPLWADKNSGGK